MGQLGGEATIQPSKHPEQSQRGSPWDREQLITQPHRIVGALHLHAPPCREGLSWEARSEAASQLVPIE